MRERSLSSYKTCSSFAASGRSLKTLAMKLLHTSWNRDLAWGLLLSAATFIAYWPAWNGQPVWDDDAYMTKPELRSATGLARIWIQPGAVSQYYPLVHTVFWVEHRLFGDATPGYHLLNIFLHVFSALLLVTILRRLGIPGEAAWLAGGIFALHPVMVESVAWITELKNTLSGVFYLAAALAYLTFDRERKKKHYAVAFIFFVLGLLSKSVIVTLPAALLAVFWWKRGSIGWKRDVAPLLPFFAIGIVAGLFTMWMERRLVDAVGSEFNVTIIDRFLIAGRALWFYLAKLLWPADLIFTYPRWHIDAAAMGPYLFPAALLLAAWLFWQVRRRSRAPLATLLYFTIALFPALGFVNIYYFRYSFVADHFQYLAGIGPITAAAACIVRGSSLLNEGFRRPAKLLLCCALLSILFLLTWKQSGMYANAETLYRTTIRKNPDCWLAHNNLGILFADRGRNEDAMARYWKALELKPDNAEAHNNLGALLEKTGRTDEALAHYRKALTINPNFVQAHNNLGLLYAKTGRTDEAITRYRRALKINPLYADAHYNLGNLLAGMGRTNKAIVHYRKALGLNPDNGGAHFNLGLLLAKTGRTDEAIVHYRKALERNPADAKIHNNLGILLVQTGRTDEAFVRFRKTLEINPQYGDAHYNFGFLLADRGRTDEAIVHYRKALELNPGDGGAHFNLGALLVKTGQTDEALVHYRKALELDPRNAGAHNNLGALLAETGRIDEAVAHYRKALEINPDDIGILENLVFTLVQKGQRTDANSVLENALASAKSAGDEARAEMIAQILAELHKDINPSQACSKTYVQ
jgi:tetratricopeptide (TPR) repeat protein